jgi:proteasome lid subunit RPN8/RPN11
MLGEDEGEQRRVVALLPQTNQSAADEQYHRFLITPEMMLAAEKQARAQRLDVIGFYHSHPEDQARPSEFDREYAWPWYSYIVVRVRDRKYDKMASWRLDDDRSHFDEEEIIEGLPYYKGADILPCIPAPTYPGKRFISHGNCYHPHPAAAVRCTTARGEHRRQHHR